MHKSRVTLTLGSGRKLPVDLMLARKDGDWFVGASFQIDGKPVRLAATASEATVRAALARLGHGAQGEDEAEPSTGGFFDSIASWVAKAARSKAVQSVLQGVATVAKNPLVRDLAKAWPAAGTALDYLGKGAEAAAAAQSLIQRAQGGDGKAKAAIAQVSQAAQQGNPNARAMVRVVQSVYKTTRAEQAQRPPAPARPSAPRIHMPMPPPQPQYQPAPAYAPNAPYAAPRQPAYPPHWHHPHAYGPPVSAGAAPDDFAPMSDPDLVNLARTVRATR